MQLGLTIPLMKHLTINKLSYGEELHRRSCWDLHCIRLHNHSCLLAVHCETRYTFVLYGMSRAQWSRLPEAFIEGLITSLRNVGIEKSLIQRYLQAAGEIELTKTHGRREVAFLNRAWDDVAALDYCIDKEQQPQPLLEHSLNHMICNCVGYEGYGEPLERMRQSLEGK
jgi:hypothetical protein